MIIKENNRKLFLVLGYIAFGLAILLRIGYGSLLILQDIDNILLYFYGLLIFLIPLILFFLTFTKQKDINVNLLFLIIVIQISSFFLFFATVSEDVQMFILLGNWARVFLLDTILIILLFLKVFKTNKSIMIVKIIILCMIWFSFIWDLIILLPKFNTTFVYIFSSYFFALVSLGIFVIQINPAKLDTKKPKLSVYVTSIFNLVLMIAFNRLLFNNTLNQDEMFYQLILILLIISIVGILEFYNKNFASYWFAVISFLLLMFYNIFNSAKGALIIYLGIGITIYLVILVLDTMLKRKEVIRIE